MHHREINRLQCIGKSPRNPLKVSGQLEILGPEGGIIVEQFGNKSRMNLTDQVTCLAKEQANGKLQVLKDGEVVPVVPIETISRPGSFGIRQSSAGRRSTTPTKQIILSAPKICPKRNGEYTGLSAADSQPLMVDVNIKPKHCPPDITVVLDSEKQRTASEKISFHPLEMCLGTKNQHFELEAHVVFDSEKQRTASEKISFHPLEMCSGTKNQHFELDAHEKNDTGSVKASVYGCGVLQNSHECLDSKAEEGGEHSDYDEDSEDEGNKAPIELLGEFLQSVMDKNYTLASKLCQMILIYEPDNPEARQFIPLIEEKLLIEQAEEQSDEEEGTDDSDEDSTDESSDLSESEDHSSGESGSSSSSEEDEGFNKESL
ncbi:glutamate-rich protein 2 isoform X2 [Lepisosteus oculatus]|uniref:glutamate-rich protein 2 isoform X2 n=1 Tax=Lepisosteus oculatus TaxID=7918 RepID=UPI0035F5141A